MNSSFDRAKKQWTLMRETARELGMRGDTLREIVGFPGIIARHACKVDRQEFRRRRMSTAWSAAAATFEGELFRSEY